ncbi:MAG TPA: histidine kinase [Pseudolysinimonas sp.]|nr:histidine kinase [Pseudolysinimonas sp.]
MKTPSRLPRPALDALVAGGFLAAALLAIWVAQHLGWYPYQVENYIGVALLCCFALGLGRAYPGLTLALVIVLVSWPTWPFDMPELRLLPLIVAGYQATANGMRLRIALPAVAVGAVLGLMPTALSYILNGGFEALMYYVDPSRRILTGVVAVTAVLLGASMHRQRRSAEELRRRNDELLRLRQVERERIAADERAVIAREIHDVVAHHVSAMVIRAQAADRVADDRPQELRSAVRGIATDGRDALTAMRQVVRVLRDDDRDAGEARSLPDALEKVAARVCEAGVAVTREFDIGAGLSEFEQTAVLRIAQEAMTNVLLHSSATEVRLSVRVEAESVRLEVLDNGAPRELMPEAALVGGSGIRGMRERALALGGTLAAGPRSDGGWSVTAQLPHGQRELSA